MHNDANYLMQNIERQVMEGNHVHIWKEIYSLRNKLLDSKIGRSFTKRTYQCTCGDAITCNDYVFKGIVNVN